MKHILLLKSSILGDASYSAKLGNTIVEEIQKKYADSTLETLDLVASEIPHLTPAVLKTFFIPTEHLTENDRAAIRLSDELIKQLFAADIIVIGAPLINLTIHTALKAWIDHITRRGISFSYDANGFPFGLITGKKVYIAMSSGGIYSEGPGKGNDFVAPYLKAFLGFLGMTDVTVFRAEGLHIAGIKENAMQKAIDSIVID